MPFDYSVQSLRNWCIKMRKEDDVRFIAIQAWAIIAFDESAPREARENAAVWISDELMASSLMWRTKKESISFKKICSIIVEY